jgi:3-deoxy-manno-octulosonate cytidylyltransferase (CMP-KDO synthetase)
MSYLIIIPARYGASRLPGKPLLDIAGKPMIQRVWEQAQRSAAAAVVVATDDQRIADCVHGFGGRACLTSAEHPSGTDRLAEVAEQLGLAADSIVVNLQGDEPLLPPLLLDQVADDLARQPDAAIATLCEPLLSVRQLLDPNVVKLVRNAAGMALYFSRAPMPWQRDGFSTLGPDATISLNDHWFRHIGLYAYRAGFLADFVRWGPAPVERIEMLEQLRALHHGSSIHVGIAAADVPPGVDTPEDLEAVRQYFLHGGASL